MTAPTLVLDLDGTLADLILDLVPVINRTTRPEGLPPIDMADVGHIVGHGAKAMLARAYSFHKVPLDAETHERLFENFLADYEENICAETVLFEGVEVALTAFGADGWRLAICTNKLEYLAVKLVKELGIFEKFDTIAGGDTFSERKPDPRHLVNTIEKAGGSPANSIMVGDLITDITAAKSAEIPIIAVDFGYSDTPVAELAPDRVISHFDELKSAATDLLAMRSGLLQAAP